MKPSNAALESWDGFFALRDSGVEEARDFLLERSDPPPSRAPWQPKAGDPAFSDP